jgi:hypothetical protein
MNWFGDEVKFVPLFASCSEQIDRSTCPEKSSTRQVGCISLTRIARSIPDRSGIITSDIRRSMPSCLAHPKRYEGIGAELGSKAVQPQNGRKTRSDGFLVVNDQNTKHCGRGRIVYVNC